MRDDRSLPVSGRHDVPSVSAKSADKGWQGTDRGDVLCVCTMDDLIQCQAGQFSDRGSDVSTAGTGNGENPSQRVPGTIYPVCGIYHADQFPVAVYFWYPDFFLLCGTLSYGLPGAWQERSICRKVRSICRLWSCGYPDRDAGTSADDHEAWQVNLHLRHENAGAVHTGTISALPVKNDELGYGI